MGQLDADEPVERVIVRMAVAASREDPRFAAVEVHELAELDIEVSVLTPLARAHASELTVGRDGVVVRRGNRQGVLLPQVATEYGWDRDRLLAEVCRKAGLPADAWRDERTELFLFQAQVITQAPT